MIGRVLQELKESVAVSVGALHANKMRSLLTMLGIIIGVSAVIIMVAISAGTEATISEQITSLTNSPVDNSSASPSPGR